MSKLKDKAVKGIFWSGALSITTQVISLIFSVLIARILSPSDYGIIAMLTIFTSIATVLQESGYVLVLTNRKEVTHSDYCTVFWFNIITSFIVYVILFFCAPIIASFYNKPELLSLSRYVFLGFFISSFGIVQNAYLFKYIKVKEKGIANIISLLVSGTIGIIMAINGYSFWGLATQGLLGTIIVTIAVWFYSPFRPSFIFDFKFLKNTIYDGIRFAIPNFFSVISTNIYSVLLGKLYTPTDLGCYSQGNKFNVIGYSFILGMLRNITQPILVQVKSIPEQFLSVFRKLFRFTIYVSMPIMFGLSFISSELIDILLTEKWAHAAIIMKILCISGFFTIISTLCTYALTSLNKTKIYMWLGITNSTVSLLVATIAAFGGVIYLALATVCFEIILFCITFFIIKKSCHYRISLLLKDFLPILSLSITYLLTFNISNIYILFSLKILCPIVLYMAFSSYFHLEIYKEISSIIIRKIKKGM